MIDRAAHLPRLSRRRLLLVTVSTLAAWAGFATGAHAQDSYPCGASQTVAWSTQPVQECPLTSPLAPNGWVPVYTNPVPNPQGAAAPPPQGWLHGTAGQLFLCQTAFPNDTYYHPVRGWYNDWWAYTLSDDNVWGWVPEVFFTGGDNDEPDAGLRPCPQPSSPTATSTSSPSSPPASPSHTPPSTGTRTRGHDRTSSRRGTQLTLRPARHSLRNGERLTLRGQLTAVTTATKLLVVLQAQVGPREWRTFAVTPVTATGTFVYVYRFTHTTAAQTYALRAVAPTQTGFSRRALISRPVHIHVSA